MMQSRNVLVTGANGQLGQCFRLLSQSRAGLDFFFTGSSELDITNESAVQDFLTGHSINYLINCAAYTAVDKAEAERETALLINGDAVGNIAKICKELNIQFIHFSTDYVFNGLASKPYLPVDTTDPVNFYGFTKLMGEKMFDANAEALLIRTSWVYSEYGKNFVKTMVQLLSTKKEISVVADQSGSPTYALDLAEAVVKIIETGNKVSGTYHYCNNGIISWFDFASAIRDEISSDCIVNPITTAEFPTAAKRPQYSALNTESFETDFNQSIPSWRQSLKSCIQKIID